MQTSSTARCAAQDTELHRLRVLYQLLTDLSRADAVEDVYEAALSSLLSATDADRASILLFDDDGVMRFKASKGLSDDYQRAVTGHTPWRAGETGAEAIPVSDVRLDANLQAYVDIFDRERIRAMAFIPLALTRGVIGKFMLYYSEPHEFARDELELGRAIANHVALATERKHAEVARLESEQRLQAILDNSTTVVFLKDVEGRYILINRRFEELFHVTKSDIIGRTDHDVFRKEVADAFRANDQAVLTAAKALEMEEYAPHDDGVHTYISIKFPIYDSDSTALRVGGIATDVTARQKTENALRLAKEGLEQFAYAAAHDLQEPMRNVCLSAQLFARHYSDRMDSRANEYIKRMVDGSRRMQTLISDLLAYTRSLECTESAESCADADEVLREVLVNLRTAIESSNAEVTHDPVLSK